MPASALGGSTQHFRAYGKRKTNVINRRQPLGGWDTSPVAAAARAASSSSSSSSSSDEDGPAPVLVKKKAAPPPPRQSAPPRRPEFEVVVAATARRPARPSQSASSRSSAAKENPAAAVRTSGAGKGKGKGKAKAVEVEETSEEEDEEEEERSPLKPRVRPAPLKKVYGGRRATTTPIALRSSSSEEDEDEDEDVVVAPPPRRRGVIPSSGLSTSSRQTLAQQRKKAPVITSEDEEEEAGSDALVEDRPSLVLADEDSCSASSSSEEDAVPPPPAATRPVARLRSSGAPVSPLPSALRALQPLLLSPTLLSFSSFASSPPPPFAPAPTWRKIGEASYSEVFAAADAEGRDMVVKIIPIAPPTGARAASADEELPFMSSLDAVAREIEVSRSLGDDEGGVEGFVRFKGAFLVQGAYPAPLLAAWDAFKRAQRPASDEQVRPHVLPPTQTYALLLLENAGVALETYRLRSWVEAAGVMAQVVDALARAEDECGFEHRDLHWGNILLQPATVSPASSLPSRFSTLSLARTRESTPPPAGSLPSSSIFSPLTLLDPAQSGVRATLIDFTLSRCAPDGGEGRVLFDAFEDDELFEGEGEYQFEVYRLMRALVVQREGGRWEGSERRTNVLWLHYLALKLLHSKRLRPPPAVHSAGTAPAPSSPRAVPSPLRIRRPMTRRLSALQPPSLSLSSGALSFPGSPAQAQPRARTAPALLPGGRKHVLLQRAQAAEAEALAREQGAHDALLRAEGALNAAVDGWALGAPKKGAKKGRGKRGEGFAGAREFAEWWFAQA
ncbi:hypothetical protein JCM10450v2_000823 [Rhodotorula kratochvilovae]